MNEKERIIMALLYKKLKVRKVENPCDINALAKFYNETYNIIAEVKDILSELQCYDVPESRLDSIIEEIWAVFFGILKNNGKLL